MNHKSRFFARIIAVLLAVLLAGMPLTVSAEGKTCVYSDVPFFSWYYDAVDYLTALGVMSGVGDGKFNPDGKLTRAMTVAILYRMNGSPDVSAHDNPFEDVPAGSWFEDAVKWAVADKVTYGTSDTAFSPERSITREELACFVVRYAESIHAEFLTDNLYADLSESIIRAILEEETSPFARDAMYTMIMEGLYHGRSGDDHYQSKETATRAETAVVFCKLGVLLYRYPDTLKLIAGEDCMEKHFDGEPESGIHEIGQPELGLIWGRLGKSRFMKVEPSSFTVYYRLSVWGTEYQFARTVSDSNVVKVIQADGSVQYMTPSYNDLRFILQYLDGALQ